MRILTRRTTTPSIHTKPYRRLCFVCYFPCIRSSSNLHGTLIGGTTSKRVSKALESFEVTWCRPKKNEKKAFFSDFFEKTDRFCQFEQSSAQFRPLLRHDSDPDHSHSHIQRSLWEIAVIWCRKRTKRDVKVCLRSENEIAGGSKRRQALSVWIRVSFMQMLREATCLLSGHRDQRAP